MNAGSISPPSRTTLFALQAEQLIHEGKTVEAIALCERGIAAYPRYGTGYIAAAKAYMKAGRYADARTISMKGLAVIPGSEGLVRMRDEAEKMVTAPPPPTQAPFGAVHDVTDEIADYDRLARALEHAKIPPALDSSAAPGLEDDYSEQQPDDTKPAIMSATIAEIYARQGALREAIAAYQSLALQNPSLRKSYENRIESLRAQLHAAQ